MTLLEKELIFSNYYCQHFTILLKDWFYFVIFIVYYHDFNQLNKVKKKWERNSVRTAAGVI